MNGCRRSKWWLRSKAARLVRRRPGPLGQWRWLGRLVWLRLGQVHRHLDNLTEFSL